MKDGYPKQFGWIYDNKGCTQLIGLLNSFLWTVYTVRDFKIRKLKVGLTDTVKNDR